MCNNNQSPLISISINLKALAASGPILFKDCKNSKNMLARNLGLISIPYLYARFKNGQEKRLVPSVLPNGFRLPGRT
jgi:hypothetical protein